MTHTSASSPARIGLVEDNPSDVEAFRRAFAPLGAIDHWPTGEGLQASLEQRPGLLGELDLLLVDLGLPGMDGVAVVRAVQEARGAGALPIVVLTGSSDEHDILRALHAEVTEYEVKPDDVDGLRELVGRCERLISQP